MTLQKTPVSGTTPHFLFRGRAVVPAGKNASFSLQNGSFSSRNKPFSLRNGSVSLRNGSALAASGPPGRDITILRKTDQISLCRNWITVMTEEVRTGWAIPPAQFTELETLFTAAEALLEQARSSERTPVVTEQCREAFAALTAKMRFFKSHYFLVPLLASADLVDLGLKPHDTHPTPSGKPVALVRADPYLWAPRELWLRIGYVFGDPEDKANKGYRIWYKVVPAGAAPVTDTEELDKSFYTRRKRDLLTFGYEDYGKTVYIAVQVENNGIKGNWGPMIWATVP